MRIGNVLGIVLGGALASGLASSAYADFIDFEDVAQAPGTASTGGDFVSNGFLFDVSLDHRHIANNAFTFMDSTALVTDDFVGAEILTMTRVSGGRFDFADASFAEALNSGSFDYAQMLTDTARQIVVTGYLFGGGTVTDTVTLDLIADGVGGDWDGQVHHFHWLDLVKVEFDGGAGIGNNYWGLDNIVATNILPLPGAAWLGLALLGGLGVVRGTRRRRATIV